VLFFLISKIIINVTEIVFPLLSWIYYPFTIADCSLSTKVFHWSLLSRSDIDSVWRHCVVLGLFRQHCVFYEVFPNRRSWEGRGEQAMHLSLLSLPELLPFVPVEASFGKFVCWCNSVSCKLHGVHWCQRLPFWCSIMTAHCSPASYLISLADFCVAA